MLIKEPWGLTLSLAFQTQTLQAGITLHTWMCTEDHWSESLWSLAPTLLSGLELLTSLDRLLCLMERDSSRIAKERERPSMPLRRTSLPMRTHFSCGKTIALASSTSYRPQT